MLTEAVELTESQFAAFAKLVDKVAGIHLPAQKRKLLSNRLRRRLRTLQISSFDEYYARFSDKKFIEAEMPEFLTVVTTNETYFLRNPKLWETFIGTVLPDIVEQRSKKGNKTIRLWSAASSSGEEAYTAAILLRENLKDFAQWKVQIVGTDISPKMLNLACEGTYGEYALSKLSKVQRQKWFQPGKDQHRLTDEIRKMVTFHSHNLRDRFSQSDFDLVLLRNVLMYFDTPMKREAITTASAAVRRGGYLYIGDVDPTRTTPELRDSLKLEPLGPGWYHNSI